MSADQIAALNEARDRLHRCVKAFSVFMQLVKDGEGLDGEAIYCLLEPVESEICAGVECLEVLKAA